MIGSKFNSNENQNILTPARLSPSFPGWFSFVIAVAVMNLGFIGQPVAKAAPGVAPMNAQPSATGTLLIASPTIPAVPAVLTFQAWKSVRTDEARLVLERLILEGQIFAASGFAADGVKRAPGERQAVVRAAQTGGQLTSPMPRSSPRAVVRPRQDNRIEQARMNLEIAQDLTINDYLHIYLSQFNETDVLRDVARRMNPDEVAELLIAYQKTSSFGELANSATAGSSRLCSGTAR